MNDAILSIRRCAHRFFNPVSLNDPIPNRIDTAKYRYFEDCIGALDGTHIDAVVPNTPEFGPYRNRKKVMSQNILGVVDFDMCFIYKLAGIEGSAHDSRVLVDKLK